jgi:hypothetical protein
MTRSRRSVLLSVLVALAVGVLVWALARRTSPAETLPRTEEAGAPERARFTGVRTGLIESVERKDGAHVVRVDYVELLTGEEAAEAASARGDESPPPNDYYVSNDELTLHELPVRPDAQVRVVIDQDGMSIPEGRPMSLEAWIESLSGPDARLFTANVYRLELTEGEITALEQIYVP